MSEHSFSDAPEEQILQRAKRRSYRAILELSARHPLLTPNDLALMIGANAKWVRSVMKSDSFLAQRAQLVQELFGPQLQELNAKMLKTAGDLIDSINRRIANPDAVVSEGTLLKAAELLLDRILPGKNNGGNFTAPQQQPAQNLKIVFNGVSPEDIARARSLALQRGSLITLEPQAHETAIDLDEDGLPKERRVRSNEGID